MTELQMNIHIGSYPERTQRDSYNEFQQAHSANDENTGTEKLICHWNSCLQEFADHSALSSHLSEDHVGWKKVGYSCDWDNCSRQGVKCHNRFALMMHLRIHTGEKPFECNYPNCGQSFGRTDALVRHKKTEHGEETSIKAPNNNMTMVASNTKAKKRTGKRSAPSLNMLSRNKKQKTGKAFGESSGDESDDSIDEIPKRTNSTKPLIPGSDYSLYRLAKAQLNYILRENQMLQDELETTKQKLKRLKTERKVLLEAVMAAEPNKNDEDDDDKIPDTEEQFPA